MSGRTVRNSEHAVGAHSLGLAASGLRRPTIGWRSCTCDSANIVIVCAQRAGEQAPWRRPRRPSVSPAYLGALPVWNDGGKTRQTKLSIMMCVNPKPPVWLSTTVAGRSQDRNFSRASARRWRERLTDKCMLRAFELKRSVLPITYYLRTSPSRRVPLRTSHCLIRSIGPVMPGHRR